MSYIDDLNQAASEALAASASATESSQIIFDVANGDENTTVTTANGEVKTLAKAIADITAELKDGVFSTTTEEITLSEGQTEITLSTATTNGMQLYVEGVREFDFTVTSETSFTLSESLPDGTRIWVVGVEFGQDASTSSVTDSSAGAARTLGGWAAGIQYTHLTVADADADTSLVVGSMVKTLGRLSVGDGGANEYVVVSAGTGTDDGGSYIDLSASGLQLEALFSDGAVTPQMFGAGDPDAYPDALQNASDFANNNFSLRFLTGAGRELSANSGYSHTRATSGADNIKINPTESFSSPATDESLINISNGQILHFNDVYLPCNNYANGMYLSGGAAWSTIENIRITNPLEYGITVDDAASGPHIANTNISGFSDEADRAGKIGIHMKDTDAKLSGSVINYLEEPLRLSGGTFNAIGNHFFNGGGGYNSKNIYLEAGSSGIFTATYLDKGRIVAEGDCGVSFFDTQTLFFSGANKEHDSVVHLVSDSTNQDWPLRFQWDGCSPTLPLQYGNMDFLTMEDGDGASWSDSALSVGRELNRYAGYPRIVPLESSQLVAEERNEIVTGSSNAKKHTFGDLTEFQNDTQGPTETFTPQGYAVNAAGLTTEFRATNGTTTSGTLTVEGSSGSDTYRAAQIQLRDRMALDGNTWDNTDGRYWEISTVRSSVLAQSGRMIFSYSASGESFRTDVAEINSNSFRPATSGDKSLGAAGYLWSEVYSSTGTINTSDERLKQDFTDLSDAEKAVAVKVKALVKKYKWISSVEEKGDDARWHFGVGAQSVKEAFESEGLNAFDYGCLCYDEFDADGDPLDRYGVRPTELLFFMMASL